MVQTQAQIMKDPTSNPFELRIKIHQPKPNYEPTWTLTKISSSKTTNWVEPNTNQNEFFKNSSKSINIGM